MHEVIDNLTSNSGTDGLSAKQGMILKGLVDELTSDLSDVDERVTTLENTGGVNISPLTQAEINNIIE